MMSVLDSKCLSDTARLLCEFFGDRAPALAIITASDLRREGREDVAMEWDLVSLKALEMIDFSAAGNPQLAN